MLLLKKKLAENNEYLSQYYIDSILALLKANPGAFSEYVLRKYAAVLEKNKGNFGKANYYKLLRLELDKIIKSARKSCDNLELLRSIDAQKKIFVDSYNKFEEVIKNPPTPTAKKPAAAKGKSGGSPAKKKATVKKAGKKTAAKKAPAKKKPAQFLPYKKKKEEEFITITLKEKSGKQPSKKEALARTLANDIFKTFEASEGMETKMDKTMVSDVDNFLEDNASKKEPIIHTPTASKSRDSEFNFS